MIVWFRKADRGFSSLKLNFTSANGWSSHCPSLARKSGDSPVCSPKSVLSSKACGAAHSRGAGGAASPAVSGMEAQTSVRRPRLPPPDPQTCSVAGVRAGPGKTVGLKGRLALCSCSPEGGGFPQTLGRVQIIPPRGKELEKCPLEGKQQRKPAVPAPGSPGLSVGGRD